MYIMRKFIFNASPPPRGDQMRYFRNKLSYYYEHETFLRIMFFVVAVVIVKWVGKKLSHFDIFYLLKENIIEFSFYKL